MRRSPWTVRAIACVAMLPWSSALAANSLLSGDFESGHRGDRPPEFWHWGGRDYASAHPDWRLVRGAAGQGEWCITTAAGRPFVACTSAAAGNAKGLVMLRAAAPGTQVTLRLSWWDRLRRADETKTIAVGTRWQRYEVAIEFRRGGPVEIAVASKTAGVRIWADDFRIEAAPLADQMIDTVYRDGEAVRTPLPAIRPRPVDLKPLQTYGGPGRDARGRVQLRIDVPNAATQIPYVSGGVPFPRGALFRPDRVRVTDAAGAPVPAQLEVLSRWHLDQSVMVLLVTVPVPAESGHLWLEYGPHVSAAPVPSSLRITEADGETAVDTGATRLRFAQGRAGPTASDVQFSGPAARTGAGALCGAEAADCRVERRGPLCAVVAVRGELKSDTDQRLGRWVTRYTFWRGSPLVQVKHCWINDEPPAMLPVQSAWFDVAMQHGREPSVAAEVMTSGTLAPGRRHNGLIDARLAVRDFWQNHPIAVDRRPEGYRIWLWPDRVRGVLLPQGVARQWEWLVDTQGATLERAFLTTAMPVLSAEPEWACASGVFEFMLPPDPQTFPIFERRIGSIPTLGRFAWPRKESGNLFGVFHYGDAPGDGGWSNLESMADHELFLHWLRTGSREHFDMARLAAEHYRDVDIHHAAGFCHTHCNNHVHSGESWSHSWVQGVRDLYLLLGDLRALEVLHEVGGRLLTKPVGWTSGRDWTRPMDNLVDIYSATGDRRYLECLRRHIDELAKRQLPEHAVCGAERNSWYEDRYAAGCAFTWYGCQAMAKLHQQTGEREVLDILRREMDLSLDVQTKSRRSHAILPTESVSEDKAAYVAGNPFALGRGSTVFPALACLARETRDPRYLRIGMNVLAHYMLNLRSGSDASATAYATIFLREAKRLGVDARTEAAAFQRARDFSYDQWPKGIANGGFERDHFEGWGVKKVAGQDFYYDKLVRVGYYLDDKVKRSGRRSLRLHSDNRSRVMSVKGKFALKPKRRWRLRVWIKAPTALRGSASAALRVYDTDTGSGVPLRATGREADEWRELAGEFATAGRTVLTVSMAARGGTGDVWFDDVTLEELGAVHRLLTSNGMGRDWRKPAYPGLGDDTGGAYSPDAPMRGDLDAKGQPIPFTQGCLTDGVSKCNHLQKPLPSYCYWTKRERGSITFDLRKPRTIRRVRVNVLLGSRGHGTQRIELHRGAADGPLLASAEPAQNGWNEFGGLDAAAQRVTLVLTRMEGRTYLTVSEVEIWGE